MKQPELGSKIASLRKKKGLTQEELVDLCNINVRTIQRIEAGEVTPRNTTIKLILEALGYDFNLIEQEEIATQSNFSYFSAEGMKQLFLIDFDPHKNISYTRNQIQLAWIGGLIYFIIGFIISGFEYERYTSWLKPENYSIYTLCQLCSFIAFLFMQRGFIIIGDLYNNSLLKIISYLLIIHELFNTAYCVVSVYQPSIESQFIDGGIAITIGAILIVYGIALSKLSIHFGRIAKAAAIFEYLAGFFLLIVVLWFVGLILLIPAELLQIVILYKAYEMLKNEIVIT